MKKSQISLLEHISTSKSEGLTKPSSTKPRSSKNAPESDLAHEERMFLRLQLYFAPYPEYRLMLGETAPEPVRMLTVSRRGDAVPRKFIVMIERRLFAKESGEWVVPTLLRLVKVLRDSAPNIESFQREDTWIAKLFEFSKSLHRKTQILEPVIVERTPAVPSLPGLWKELVQKHFPEQPDLISYRVIWSYRRHTSTLASCHVDKKIVRVAAIMQHAEALPYLEPLVYHEMCHAALGPILRKNGRRVMHGRDFKALEKRHPGIPHLNRWIKSGGWHSLVRRAKRTRRG